MNSVHKWYGLRQGLRVISDDGHIVLQNELSEWITQVNEHGVRVRTWCGSMINFIDDAAEAEFVLRFGSLTDRP